MQRWDIVAVVAGGLTLASAPAWSQGVNLNGRYQAVGTNFDGTRYQGTAEIAYTTDTSCRITWRISGSTIRGICMRFENAFAASYIMDGKPGMIIYQLHPDGSLEGYWTLADQSGVGSERLMRTR